MIDANAPHSATPKTERPTPTTDQIRSVFMIGAYNDEQVHNRGLAFDRWLAEYTRQQREEAVTDLENGRLPEGYMIVSVRDLTDTVIRALKEATK